MELVVSSSRTLEYLFPQQLETLAQHEALGILQTVFKDFEYCVI